MNTESLIGKIERFKAIHQDILDRHDICPRQWHEGAIDAAEKIAELVRTHKPATAPDVAALNKAYVKVQKAVNTPLADTAREYFEHGWQAAIAAMAGAQPAAKGDGAVGTVVVPDIDAEIAIAEGIQKITPNYTYEEFGTPVLNHLKSLGYQITRIEHHQSPPPSVTGEAQ